MRHSRASGFQFFHVGYLQAYTRYSFVLITVKSLAAALHGTTVKNCGTNSAFCMLFFITCKGRQEDAQEFLSCILNGMHEEMLQLSQLVSVPDKGTICQILLRAYCSLLLLLVVFNTLYPPPPPTLHKLLSSNALGKIQYSQEHLKTMVYAKFGRQTECIMGI